MMDIWGLVAITFLGGLLIMLIGAILGWRAFLRVNELGRRMGRIEAQLQGIAAELSRLRGEAPAETKPEEQVPEEQVPEEEAPEEEAPEETAEEAGPEPEEEIPAAAAVAAPAEEKRGTLEKSLTGRWMVWLGAVALALGGAFLVQYTIEHDLIGPRLRVGLGLLIGLGLIGGGQVLRRSRGEAALERAGTSYVPAALTAAGSAIVYASIYSGFVFVGMYGPLAAFAGLAATSALTMLLALKQGAFVAALGLAGAYVTPFLVPAETATAFMFFGYLVFVHAGALAIIQYRNWMWLSWLSLAAGVIWPTLWFIADYDPAEVPALAGYSVLLILLPAAFFWRSAVSRSDGGEGEGHPLALDRDLRVLTLFGFACAAVAVGFATVRMGGYDGISLIAYAAIAAVLTALAWRAPRLWPLLPLTAAAGVLLLATWHIGAIAADYLRPPDPNLEVPRVLAPELARFLLISAAWGAALYGAGLAGALLRPQTRQAWIWATVGASSATVLLVAYWRIEDFETDLAWGAAALGVAAVQVLGAHLMAQRGRMAALAPFAVAATASLSLALAMSLERAWLTIALSLQVAFLAWLQGWLRLRALDWLAGVVAAVVVVRLIFNPYILDYGVDPTPIFNWLLYGYGVPLAAFWASFWKFREMGPQDARAHPVLLQILDGGRLVFLVALVLFETNHLLHGGDFGRIDGDLGEMALYLALLGGLLLTPPFQTAPGKADAHAVIVWGLRVLWPLIYIEVVVLRTNPLFDPSLVGTSPVVNLLGLAYGLPAVMLAVFSWMNRKSYPRLAEIAGFGALALSLLYLTLEVRRAFVGSEIALDAAPVGEAELWAYSVVWIAYALVLMALALVKRLRVFRFASLAVLLLAVAKVFIVDLAELEGIWRALSFLGLGLTLVGIGWVYQRFVFAPTGKDAPAEDG